MNRQEQIKASICNIGRLLAGCLYVISGVGLIIISIIMWEGARIIAKHMTEINNISIVELNYLTIFKYPPIGIALIIIGVAEIREIGVSPTAFVVSVSMSFVSFVTGLYIVNKGGSFEAMVFPSIVLISIILMWIKQNKKRKMAT